MQEATESAEASTPMLWGKPALCGRPSSVGVLTARTKHPPSEGSRCVCPEFASLSRDSRPLIFEWQWDCDRCGMMKLHVARVQREGDWRWVAECWS